MTKLYLKAFTVLLLSFVNQTVSSQKKYNNALDYLKEISGEQQYLMQKNWDYINAFAHSNNMLDVVRNQEALIKGIDKSIKRLENMPDFKNKTIYRDAAINYFKNTKLIYQEEYGEMIDLKKVKFTSYNAMANYMQLQELAHDKLEKVTDEFQEAHELFAAMHNIKLLEVETALARKMEKAGAVMEYKNKMELAFFKSYIEESELITAFEHDDEKMLHTQNEKFKKAIKEEELALKNIKPYHQDVSLKETVAKLLTLYKNESETYIPVFLEYYKTKNDFEKLETKLNNTPERKRTKKQIDAYNNFVKKINKSVKSYNLNQDKLNQERSKLINLWNREELNFLDRHVPKDD